MSNRFRDDVITAALVHARGDDRAVLAGALAWSTGSEAVPVLQRLLTEKGPGSAHVRAVALDALGERLGEAGTPLYTDALADSAYGVQVNAAIVLAECGDERGGTGLLAWFRRRLLKKNREVSYDPCEVPAVITYAVRHNLLGPVAAILKENPSRLSGDERERLAVTWPEVANQGVDSGIEPPRPDAARLHNWLYESMQRTPTHEQRTIPDELEISFVRDAISRSMKPARGRSRD